MTPFISSQDEDLTPHIGHYVDLMASDDGRSLEFFYNYLVYTFEDGAEHVIAKHYLDTPERSVSISSRLTFPLSNFAMKVLGYLTLRFGKIDYLTDEGYVPLPGDTQNQIAATLSAMTSLRTP